MWANDTRFILKVQFVENSIVRTRKFEIKVPDSAMAEFEVGRKATEIVKKLAEKQKLQKHQLTINLYRIARMGNWLEWF